MSNLPPCDHPTKFGVVKGTVNEILDRIRAGNLPFTCAVCGEPVTCAIGDCLTVQEAPVLKPQPYWTESEWRRKKRF